MFSKYIQISFSGVMSLRYAQGHSFSNLGFAYGQLGELEKSHEYFSHALQAAKDCQDFCGQWQALEGLSAIHYQKKDYGKAVNCLKNALTVLPLGGTSDHGVHERIVGKLSNALESQVAGKQTNKQIHKQTKVEYKKPLPKEPRRKDKNIEVQVHTTMDVDGSLQENGGTLEDNYKESTPKVGHVRPREKNHKYIARGLHIDEQSSEQSEGSEDSTFDTISSYSGQASSSMHENGSVHQLSNLESTAGSAALPPPKKDPLNNTYEEPQDIVNIIETGKLRLHDLPPGPRDTVLASMNEDLENQQLTTLGKHRKNNTKNKSTICVIQ